VVAAVVLAGAASVAAATEPDRRDRPDALDARIEQVRRQVLDETFQPALPHREAGGGSSAQTPALRGPGERAVSDRARIDTREQVTAGGSSLLTVLLWGVVIVAGALAVMWLVSELSRYGGDAALPAAGEADLSRVSAAVVERPLGDADELARRGELAAAIHTLLLRTLQALVRGAAVRVAPAMTSREILARVPLSVEARGALADLITAVEITHFGDEPVGTDDYERCRQQFHRFAAAFGRGAAVAA
jgi:hypothetical protein